ncbi:MAG: VWA domain-containing protein [Noviherbaspirillum sp.]
MSFLWPSMTWLLLLVPAAVLMYLFLLRRRKHAALRYASLEVVKEAMGPRQGWRRHVPPILFLLGLTAMLVAVARPAAVLTLPSEHETVVLAIDVSGSMRADDVEPTRLAAAESAARTFVEAQPRSTRLALVSFAGTASLVQTPTRSKDDILAAMERFQLQHGTAVGSGILVALQAIFPEIEFNLRSPNPRMRHTRDPARPLDQNIDSAAAEFIPVQPGSYQSAAIILLTDGQTTTGPDPIEAAKMAAERGVRVYTVGIGTPEGEIVGAEGWSMRVRLDEESLKQIAKTTHAEYFYAGNAADLTQVYKKLHSRLTLEKKETEITALFAAAGALFAMLAAFLSVLWYHRVL